MTAETEHNEPLEGPFRLGDWLVEPRLNRLSRGDESIQIEHKMMDVLVCLAEKPGDLVPRQHIIDTVWAIEFISEGTLTRIVAELRRALGDDAREPCFIETIRGKGYRLLVPVEVERQPSATIAQFPVRAQEDDRNPYPGLAAFTEADAEFFFGREAEVTQLWRKITSRRLLAVIGPSGVGKTSFLRAGLLPATPEGWGTLICQPGEAPFAALARALAPEFEGDAEAISRLVDISDPARAVAVISRWRGRHDQALLTIDQLEELFTLNAPEVQARFAALLGRLARDVDVHVVLSMRDDFLYRCHEQEPLTPIFSGLVPVKVPADDDLRRALIEPAARFGYAFEDENLVDEMLDAVAGERGALPLLAFAVERLWVHRDREKRQLTGRAYADIGGVAGALAHHAEATIDRIGADRVPIVRELFRNLITAEGTRAVRDWNELLSVFDRGHATRAGINPAPTTGIAAAEEVLRGLIDARLLNSYEIREGDEAPKRRVEIIHESLLANWPRLVRWQTQDADSAQLRDQLRQAAKTWDEHDRSDDLLWTGSAFREYAVWRERYAGGLTDTEEAFTVAMTGHARRRKRRRRIAVAVAFGVLLAVLAVVSVSRQQAIAEFRRAEAAKLLALAQVQLDTDPTEALAYATSSLELADTQEARIFLMRALWAGPPLRALDLGDTAEGMFAVPTFNPDGRWLAVAGLVNENVLVSGDDGQAPVVLGGHAAPAADEIRCAWTGDGLLVTGHWTEGRARVWAMPEGRLIRTIEFGGPAGWYVGDTHLLAEVTPRWGDDDPGPMSLRRWRLPDGETEDLGTVNWPPGASNSCFDRDGWAWIYARDDSVYSRSLPVMAGVPDTLLASHSSEEARVSCWRRPQGIYSSDSNGEIILWTTADGASVPGRRLRTPETATTRLKPDPAGRWAVDADGSIREGKASLWDLQGLAGARPIELRRSGSWYFSHSDFHPGGTWVVATTNHLREVSFWPLRAPSPLVVDGYETRYQRTVAFAPDGRYLVTHWGQDRVRLWPLPGAGDHDVVDVKLLGTPLRCGLAVDPTGKNVLSTGYGTEIFLVSLTGAGPRRLDGLASLDIVRVGAFSPSGRLVAAASEYAESRATLRVWDLSSGESRVFDQPQDPEAEFFTDSVAFVDETTLYTSGAQGLLRWDLETGTSERILEAPPGGSLHLCMASDRRTSLVSKLGPSDDQVGAVLCDLKTGEVRSLDLPGGHRWALALSPDGTTWATGEKDGSIWIGRTDGGEAHLLAGHEGPVDSVAISPDNAWIASSGDDKTLRLWPMPDLSKPPLHTLPRDELIAKLKTLTNLRAVRDEETSTGWKIEVGPFPGWETVPSW